MIRLSDPARALLGSEDVLVFDWHPLAVCCAAAGEVDLRRTPRRLLARRYLRLPSEPDGVAYAAPAAYPHLVDRDVAVDARRRLGLTSFSCDLPTDFGLRVSFGREAPSPPSTDAAGTAADTARGVS
jgi:hypothetical protein